MHDLFSGDLIDIMYKVTPKNEELLKLSDETEIDDILNLAFDPLAID